MQKELDRLRRELKSAEAQIKSLHGENLAKDSKLQCAKASKANESIRNQFNTENKQDTRMSASASCDAILSYQPCGISPKNQLTGTDTTAYAP